MLCVQIHTGSQGATGREVVFCPAWRPFSVTSSGAILWKICAEHESESGQRFVTDTHTGLFWVQCELQISVCSRCFFHRRATTQLRVEWVTLLLYSASMTCSHPQYEALDWVWRRGTHRFHLQTKTRWQEPQNKSLFCQLQQFPAQ